MKKLEETYLVLKWEDINKLPEHMIDDIKSIIEKIQENRTAEKKIPMVRLIDVACYD